jgi:hypothetical protein
MGLTSILPETKEFECKIPGTTVTCGDLLKFLIGIIPKLIPSIFGTLFNIDGLVNSINIILNGKCAGSSFDKGLAIFAYTLFFLATLLPFFMAALFPFFWLLFFSFAFNAVNFWMSEDLEARCS